MKKSILSILAILLLIGAGSALVYVGYNYMARTTIDIPATGEEGIETFVSVNGEGWTNSLGLNGVESGDTINITLRHENKYANDIVGDVVYIIQCEDGLSWATGMDEGSILDFYDINATGADGDKMLAGLIFTDTYGLKTGINCNESITKLEDYVAQIQTTEINRTFPAGSTCYTELEMTFHEKAHGRYFVDGRVMIQ